MAKKSKSSSSIATSINLGIEADTFLRADYVFTNPLFNDSDWFRKDDIRKKINHLHGSTCWATGYF